MSYWFEFDTTKHTTIVDKTTSPTDTTYIWYAAPGNLPNVDKKVWMIKKVFDDWLGTTTIGFANGRGKFEFVWDDRTTYNYK